LCLPPFSSGNDASIPSVPIFITPPLPSDPPLPPATTPPPPPHSFSKPPITRVFSHRPKNLTHLPSSSTTSASPDEPVVVDSNNNTIDESSIVSDELQVGPQYNLQDRSSIHPADKYGFPHVNAIVDEPSTYQEASRVPEWQLAMFEELAALDRQDTWDLVPLPSHVVPITSKWVFKVKTKSDGSIERYKARLVARGFQQTQGLDYDETFAPVAHMTTVRTLLAVAAASSWPISQMDVKNAFLHGDLTEEVYMQPPPGVVAPPGYVCRLRRALYGLKQAPRAWHERFVSVIQAAGFSPSDHDPALFVHLSPRGRTLLLLYVDDMLITSQLLLRH
jgi:hypothetical protein